jgi:hypothetical protein
MSRPIGGGSAFNPGGIMKKTVLLLSMTLISCATMQNYNSLTPRDKTFYNLLLVDNKNPNDFSALKTQQERDDYLAGVGYIQKYNALPEHVRKAILDNEIVQGAPEFTVYMAAGKPIKEQKQVSMEGERKILHYLRCAKESGANAGKFVSERGLCAASVSAAFKASLTPMPPQRDPILAEAINYVVTIKSEVVDSVSFVSELPR